MQPEHGASLGSSQPTGDAAGNRTHALVRTSHETETPGSTTPQAPVLAPGSHACFIICPQPVAGARAGIHAQAEDASAGLSRSGEAQDDDDAVGCEKTSMPHVWRRWAGNEQKRVYV